MSRNKTRSLSPPASRRSVIAGMAEAWYTTIAPHNPLGPISLAAGVQAVPGLGIELDENALEDKLGHDWRNPESYDADDGSVVDW